MSADPNRRLPDGLFVSFEGVEGSGKSTQIERLAAWLEEAGHSVTIAREPGTTEVGEWIRRFLLETAPDELAPEAELALFVAARAQLAAEVIRPALAEGRVVLVDRFGDSSTAYQGYGYGLDPERVEEWNAWATDGLEPDLTVLIDVPVSEGAVRRGGRAPDRLERRSRAYHERVREGYDQLARNHSDRFCVIEGRRSIGEIQSAIRDRVRELLAARTPQRTASE